MNQLPESSTSWLFSRKTELTIPIRTAMACSGCCKFVPKLLTGKGGAIVCTWLSCISDQKQIFIRLYMAQKGCSIDRLCAVNSSAPFSVMCISSSSRTPNSPRM